MRSTTLASLCVTATGHATPPARRSPRMNLANTAATCSSLASSSPGYTPMKNVRFITASVFTRSPDDPVRDVLERGMAQQVAGKQAPRLDPVGLEEPDEVGTAETRGLTHGDDEAEPGRLRVRQRLRKEQPILVRPQRVHEPIEVRAPARDEPFELAQLRAADRRLHVGHLQVVADVAVHVLVIVSGRQRSELLAEPGTAGIALAARAVAVPAPVAEGAGDAAQLFVVGHDAATFAHGDVVRGIERHGAEMTERAGQPAAIPGAQRVAIVFDDPQVVFLRQVRHDVQIERHAERMRHHDRARPRSDRVAQLIGIRRVVAQVDVDEDRHEVVLQDRREGRRESGRDGDDLVARFEPPIAKLRRGERRQRDAGWPTSPN